MVYGCNDDNGHELLLQLHRVRRLRGWWCRVRERDSDRGRVIRCMRVVDVVMSNF